MPFAILCHTSQAEADCLSAAPPPLVLPTVDVFPTLEAALVGAGDHWWPNRGYRRYRSAFEVEAVEVVPGLRFQATRVRVLRFCGLFEIWPDGWRRITAVEAAEALGVQLVEGLQEKRSGPLQ